MVSTEWNLGLEETGDDIGCMSAVGRGGMIDSSSLDITIDEAERLTISEY
jgi:hypothetical protein